MSIRIWEERATQKKQVEDQRERILNAFKQRKVADKWGMVKAEKLFTPIPKLLGEKEAKPGEKGVEKTPVPDYTVAGEDMNFFHELPFADEEKQDEDPYEDLAPFTEDEMWVPATESQVGSDQEYEWDEIFPLPEKSSPSPEEVKPLPDPDEFGSEVRPGEKQPPQSAPSYSEATKDDKPPKYKEPRGNDSRDLSTLNKFIKNSEGKPGATIETKKITFFGI